MFYELKSNSLKFQNIINMILYMMSLFPFNKLPNHQLGDDDHKNISSTKRKTPKNHQLILLSRVRKQKSLYTLKKSLKMNPIKIKRLLTQST